MRSNQHQDVRAQKQVANDQPDLSARIDYYRGRARRERLAAEIAACPEAQSVHLQLADMYDRLIHHSAKPTLVAREPEEPQPLIILSSE